MSFWKRLSGQFVDVIEWTNDDGRTLVTRFERDRDEIKYGAKLIVREGQSAVFVREGQLADVFAPGTHTLETRNMPVYSTLAAWKHGFNSPFKAEVWFCSTKQFTGLKWGTKNPIILRDREFGVVRLRAFGTFAVRIALPGRFLKEIVGTESHFQREEIEGQLRDMVVAKAATALAEADVPVLDLARHYDQLANFLENKLREDFSSIGLSLTNVLVENVSLPPEVEAMLDKRTSMNIVGDLGAFGRFQAADAMSRAADQPGNGLGAGMGVGLGMAMAQHTAGFIPTAAPAAAPGATPPPLPASFALHIAEGGAQVGPFDVEACRELVRTGRLRRDTLVWHQGLAAWTRADGVPALAAMLAAAPPPLPPA